MGDYENMSQWLLSASIMIITIIAIISYLIYVCRFDATIKLTIPCKQCWTTDLDVVVLKTWSYGTIIIIFMTTVWQYLDDKIITGNFNHDYHNNRNIAHPYYGVLIQNYQ